MTVWYGDWTVIRFYDANLGHTLAILNFSGGFADISTVGKLCILYNHQLVPAQFLL
jgi:hypothetical protein